MARINVILRRCSLRRQTSDTTCHQQPQESIRRLEGLTLVCICLIRSENITSVKHKAVHPCLFVLNDAKAPDELWLGAQSSESSQKPAVASIALNDIVGACAIDEEFVIIFKYILEGTSMPM